MFNALGRKHYIWAGGALAGFLVLLGILAFIVAPKMAHAKIISGLAAAGFETRFIQKPQVAFGAILYKDVAFDEDDFSTIKYIKVTYNPLMLVLTGTFNNLDIIHMNITGDWADENMQSLRFAGWTPPADLSKIPLTSFKHITFTKTRLSMLTQTMGGMSVFLDIHSNRNGKKTEFQGNIKSEQKYLSVVASASGVVDGPRWYSDIEIIDGKFEVPSGNFKATRLSGWVNVSNSPFKIMSQLRAGAITLYDLPWQAASSTLEFSNNDTKFFTEAKSVGYDGLELELNIFKKSTAKMAASGSLHADTTNDYFEYFSERESFARMLKDMTPNRKDQNINVDFLLIEDKKLRYEIKKDEQGIGTIGTIILP
jgi:hypothetical protein